MSGDPIGPADELESLLYVVAHLRGDLPWARHLVATSRPSTRYTPGTLKRVLASKVATLADRSLFQEGDVMYALMEEVSRVKAGMREPDYDRYLMELRTDTPYPWPARVLDDFTDGEETAGVETPAHCVAVCPEREPTPPPLVEALARECDRTGQTLEAVITGKLDSRRR
jgi:hypothetical protein